MRLLALDYGEKNIGMAASDESGVLASELPTVSPTDFWKVVPKILAEKEIDTIIIGLPIGLSGQETESTQKVKKFIEKMKTRLKVTIITRDERFTTDLAKRLRPGKGHHDSLVAQILLQEYLDQAHERV